MSLKKGFLSEDSAEVHSNRLEHGWSEVVLVPGYKLVDDSSLFDSLAYQIL